MDPGTERGREVGALAWTVWAMAAAQVPGKERAWVREADSAGASEPAEVVAASAEELAQLAREELEVHLEASLQTNRSWAY